MELIIRLKSTRKTLLLFFLVEAWSQGWLVVAQHPNRRSLLQQKHKWSYFFMEDLYMQEEMAANI